MTRRWTMHVTVCAAALLGVIGCANDPATSPPTATPPTIVVDPLPPLPHPGVFAYTTDTELVVRDSTRVLTRISGRFDPSTTIGFTGAGDWVFWTTTASGGGLKINAKNLTNDRTDEQVFIDCGCTRVLPTTGNALVWLGSDGKTILRRDLSTRDASAIRRTLPPELEPGTTPDGSRTTVALLASRGERLLMTRTVASLADRSVRIEPFTIESDGTTRGYGPLAEVNGFPQRGAINPDGNTAVVFADPTGGANSNPCTRTSATFLDLNSGTHHTTIPIPSDCVAPTETRWQSDGLTVTLQIWQSPAGQPSAHTTLWQYRNESWDRAPGTNIAARATTNIAATLELSSPSQSAPFHLYLTNQGDRTELATQVHSFAVA